MIQNIFTNFSKMEFMQWQSRIYARYLLYSFPLIRSHAILGGYLCRAFAAECTFRMLCSRPSAAGPRWGVVQPVGHLTVNEDGEGSNPSAPANFTPARSSVPACRFFRAMIPSAFR